MLIVGIFLAPSPVSTSARFVDQPSVAVAATVDRLDPPTNVTCSGGVAIVCNATLLARPQLIWTAAADGYAEGYQVLRSSGGGPYAVVATAVGRLTTSWTDTGTLSTLTTYSYVVRSYAGAWTSAPSAAVTITVVLGP